MLHSTQLHNYFEGILSWVSHSFRTLCVYVKAELDELVKGLQDSGVLEGIRRFPDFFLSSLCV